MARLEFAVSEEWGVDRFSGVAEAADLFEQTFREVQLEEQLGFRYHFIVEHQGSFNIGQCQSPTAYLAALARHTSTIRIGGMVFPLPFHNPMRLAQDNAMVDQLSRGRVEFGVGTGPREHEFMRWNMPFSERRAMAMEALEIIEKAWTEESVTYEGKYWQFDEAIPLPKPYQKPHPPIWWGGISPDSLEYAAAHNYNMGMFLETDTVLAERHELWMRLWKEAGHKGPMPRSLLSRSVYVAETDEQAREEVAAYLTQAYTWGDERQKYSRITEYKGDYDRSYRSSGESMFHGMTTGVDFWQDTGLGHVGSPETVIRRIEEQQKLIGHDVFLARFRFGPMPAKMVEKSLTLFGEKVLPAFS